MKQREKVLSGFIANLTDNILTFRVGDSVTTDFLPSKEYGSGYHNHFDGEFDNAGEIYGQLNGCFRVCHPKNAVTAAEKAEASKICSREPKVPKVNQGRQYFIVPRAVAIKAMLENWECLPYLLIPANLAEIDSNKADQGFILASLLRPETIR